MKRVSKSNFQFHIPKHNLTLTTLELEHNSSSSISVKVQYNGSSTTYNLNQSNRKITLKNITLNANSNFQITTTPTTIINIAIQITCPNVSGYIIYNSDMAALHEYHQAANGTPASIADFASQGQGNPIVAPSWYGARGNPISRSLYENYWNIT